MSDSRVLVVEDDDDTRLLLRTILEEEGYRVQTAADGLQALQILEEQPRPAVLLLDLMLPRMDGWVLVERIRGSPLLAKMPIVAMSALRGRAIPCTEAFLKKPFGLGDVIEQVSRFARPKGRLLA